MTTTRSLPLRLVALGGSAALLLAGATGTAGAQGGTDTLGGSITALTGSVTGSLGGQSDPQSPLAGSLQQLTGSLEAASSSSGTQPGPDVPPADSSLGELSTTLPVSSLEPMSAASSEVDLGGSLRSLICCYLGSLGPASTAPLLGSADLVDTASATGSAPGAGSLGSATESLGTGSAPSTSSLAPLVGSVTGSLPAASVTPVVGSLGALLPVLVPVVAVGGSIAAGVLAAPMLQQSLSGMGIALPPLPALPQIPGFPPLGGSANGEAPVRQAPVQQAPVQQPGGQVPGAPGPQAPNGRG